MLYIKNIFKICVICNLFYLLLYFLFVSTNNLLINHRLNIKALDEKTSYMENSVEYSIAKNLKYRKFNSNNIDNCYTSPDNYEIKIIHIISTRFLLNPKHWNQNNTDDKIYNEKYILNGFRVMKKYLIPSLDNQSCKNFIWILALGDKANITYIKNILNLNLSFKAIFIYQRFYKEYVKNLSEGFDILITTRMDYDDRIYYDAVNDVRKAININKPALIYGYLRGIYYFEEENKYYEFFEKYNNQGAIGIFLSLIVVLNKINDTFVISDLGIHSVVKKNLLKFYKIFGIKEINYDPAIFDSGTEKFVYIRQKYSNAYERSMLIKKKLKEYKFDLDKFYGK